MLISVLLLLLGFVMLCIGAELLVGGSSRLALRLGIAPLVIGLTIVAFGTSAPELAVSIEAAGNGQSALALGNVVGSNIANIGLILGITALILPIRIETQLVKRQIPMLIVASLLLWALVFDGEIGPGDGLLLCSALLAYLYYNYRHADTELYKLEQALETEVPLIGFAKLPTATLMNVTLIASGLLLLISGSHLFVANAVSIAQTIGVSEAVIGLTIVAIGTSVPELATSIVAAIRGQSDIAIGNVIGSNLFNILGILGVTSLISAISAEGIDFVDFSVMILFTCVLLPISRTQLTISRLEGMFLLVGYFLYMGYVVLNH